MQLQTSFRGTTRFANLALCCGLVMAAAMLYYHQGLFMPHARRLNAHKDLAGGYSFGNDFYQIWLTARECLQRRSDPYTEKVTQEIQVGLYGRVLDPHNPSDPKDRRSFPYPAFVDLLIWPASRLPFPAARILVLCILLPLSAATLLLWMKTLGWFPPWQWTVFVLALSLTSYPVLEGLYAGQVGLLVGFLLAASILALCRDKLLLSGTLIALGTIKPQMSVLVIMYLVCWSLGDLRVRKRFLVGLIATLSALVISALIVWPNWIQSWIHILRMYRGYNPPPLLSQVVGELFGPSLQQPLYLLSSVLLLGGAVWLAWRTRHAAAGSLDFWLTLTLLMAITTVVILSGQAVYDHILLLPGILLLASRRREWSADRVSRFLLTIGAVVLFWPWLAACGLLLIRPMLSHDLFFSKTVFLLPLYFAVGLPFVVLAPLVLAVRSRSCVEEIATVVAS